MEWIVFFRRVDDGDGIGRFDIRWRALAFDSVVWRSLMWLSVRQCGFVLVSVTRRWILWIGVGQCGAVKALDWLVKTLALLGWLSVDQPLYWYCVIH